MLSSTCGSLCLFVSVLSDSTGEWLLIMLLHEFLVGRIKWRMQMDTFWLWRLQYCNRSVVRSVLLFGRHKYLHLVDFLESPNLTDCLNFSLLPLWGSHGFKLNVSQTSSWIVLKCGSHVHVTFKINSNNLVKPSDNHDNPGLRPGGRVDVLHASLRFH